MTATNRTKWITRAAILIPLIILLGLGLFAFSKSRYNMLPRIVNTLTTSPASTPFPTIETDKLSPLQQKVVTLLEQEYRAQPAGTKYSDGEQQPWCANFVSWIYREAGQPFSNPHSGSWRIPGVYTLEEYLVSADRFQPADTNYQPKVGDSMLYDNPSAFGQHTNIIVAIDGDQITTVGGNEANKIRVQQHSRQLEAGFVGYGEL